MMAGDFRQVLPVMPNADAEKIKAHAVTRHPYFKENKVTRFSLATNKRASNMRRTLPSSCNLATDAFLCHLR